MDPTYYYVTLVVATIGLYFLVNLRRKSKLKFPPGPRTIPIFGNALQLLGKSPSIHMDLSRKYGSIYRLKFGDKCLLMISDAKLIREAFNLPVFSGRPQDDAVQFLAGGPKGIVSAQGETWVEHRRFTMRNLRDFGFGRNSMEVLITEEVKELLDWLQKVEGRPINRLQRRLALAVLNSIWMISSGHRFAHDDPKLIEILDEIEKLNNMLLTGGFTTILAFLFPNLAQAFPNLSGWNKLLALSRPRDNFLNKMVVEHEASLPEDESTNPRDFVDAYLMEIRRTTNPQSIFHPSQAGPGIRSVLADLFVAGSDTTSTTLNWSVLYLMTHPEVQGKLQDEIDRVVGKTRLPSLTDRPKMPYTEALICETLRMSSILPMGVGHRLMEDTEFHGYFLPKGTQINANQYVSHHDPKVWGDPENFRPERFLNETRTGVIKHESLLPFTVGKRVCLGESLAKDELFLFITSIFQRFKAIPDPDQPNATLEPKLGGLVLAPHPYWVIMKDRLG